MTGSTTSLRTIAEVALGRQRAPQHETGPNMVSYLRAANVKDGSLDLSDVKKMNFTPKEQQIFSLRPGDVLVTEGSGSLSAVGASSVWNGELSGTVCFQNTLLRLRPRGDTDSRFLSWWARYAHADGLFASVATGANIYHLSAERVRALPCNAPPAAEQRRIADFLDAETAILDRLLQQNDRLMKLLRERQKGVIEHEVNRASEKMVKLSQRISLLRDGTHQPPPRVPSGIPLLTARNVSSGEVRLTDLDTHVSEEDATLLERSLKIHAADILLSVKGTIGACAIVPNNFPRAVLDRNVALIRPAKEISSNWLLWVLRCSQLQEQMRLSITAAAQPGLPLGDIRNLRIPDLNKERQELIVERISRQHESAQYLLQRARARSELLTERRRALITAAVTGQFDVSTASGRGVTE